MLHIVKAVLAECTVGIWAVTYLGEVGLTVAGFGGGPLYPLTVDAFYAKAGHRLDSVRLRWALLVVPALAVIGAATQRPRTRT
ncbi:MAG: hypothetical protein WCI22_00620 [Actinomycetota bacterium]